jgi:LmbE family N-acetylglucosaminyl deacetylase
METRTNRTLLVVLAHPDDESFGIGGTLAKAAAAGVRVVLVCATRGQAGIPGLTGDEAGALRQKELEAAAAALGINELRWLQYMDGRLGEADTEEVVALLATIMWQTRPQAVITFGPDGISGHPDHMAIHRFTTIAVDRALPYTRLYYMAASKATEQGCGVPLTRTYVPDPLVSIDIEGFQEAKVRAMQCHASQKPPFEGSPAEEATKLFCHEFLSLLTAI